MARAGAAPQPVPLTWHRECVLPLTAWPAPAAIAPGAPLPELGPKGYDVVGDRAIVVPDDLRRAVLVVDWDGKEVAAIEPTTGMGPMGDICVAEGRVYVSFEHRRTIEVFTLGGERVRSLTWSPDDQATGTWFSVDRVWVTESGNVYCLERMNGRDQLVGLHGDGTPASRMPAPTDSRLDWVTQNDEVLCVSTPSRVGASSSVEIRRFAVGEATPVERQLVQLPLAGAQRLSQFQIVGVQAKRIYFAFRVNRETGPGEFIHSRAWWLGTVEPMRGEVIARRATDFVHASRWRPRLFRVGAPGTIYLLASRSHAVPPTDPVRYALYSAHLPIAP